LHGKKVRTIIGHEGVVGMKGLFCWAYCVNRYAFLLPVILYTAHVLTARLMQVKKIVSTISGGSTYLTTQVKDYVESVRFYSAYSILKEVVKQFPCITDVSVTRTVDQTMYCDGTIKNIAYYVNNEQVITDDGALFSVSYFDSFLIQQAKKCSVNNDFLLKNVNKILLFLNKIPEDIFSVYDVSIHNEYDVRLYPLSTTEYYSKLTLEISFNQQIMHEAIMQISNIKKQYSTIYKNNQWIVIDMRFKDQIVFTKEDKEVT
jgi:hypothetical protein